MISTQQISPNREPALPLKSIPSGGKLLQIDGQDSGNEWTKESHPAIIFLEIIKADKSTFDPACDRKGAITAMNFARTSNHMYISKVFNIDGMRHASSLNLFKIVMKHTDALQAASCQLPVIGYNC
ncbi:hypothetical protein Nepgr_016374 [Nepenthes gracilis]|uniref:Uncharacterized protein n=1 Tax=Nepenthes gracilis TaxID=150966 RepID=A0AAD3XRJ9_NEPGR|nr:hypothetical protein Nepgr_016374 [Nepenthes gracilis]